MAEALSIPHSSSIWSMICSIISFSFCSSSRFFSTIASPSTTLDAAKRSGYPALSAWSLIRAIIPCIHLCIALSSGQKSIISGFSWYFATWIACSTSSPMPSPLAADIGITGTPNWRSSSLILIEPPLTLISSIILSATTIGILSSISCMVR